MRKLFGTDGIRGVANQYPMNAEMLLNLGRAIAHLYGRKAQSRPKIVIGQDTRISGSMLAGAAASGICSMGVDACLAGVLPTPGVAVATTAMGASAGIVISASHNPFYDNGIKIFRPDGFKLSDQAEAEIEQFLLEERQAERTAALCGAVQETGSIVWAPEAAARYAAFLKQSLPPAVSFKGLKVVLDCAHGATHQVAPALLAELGADVEAIFIAPDGVNINDHCGSQHPQTLQQKVQASGADVGLAFDGDGDRLIAVDEEGQILTGDQILTVCAHMLQQQGKLRNNLVVSTVMSNMGFKAALEQMGIAHRTSQVGDRYVLEQMQAGGAVLGGEDSGHMIFADHQTTGDGLLSGLKLIEAMLFTGKPLSQLRRLMTVFPQELINVDVARKPEIRSVPEIVEAVQAVEARLGSKGRVLVRYSGTQPVCRVMVEGPTVEETRRYCREITEVIQVAIGANATN